jgi:hypothetical protein
MIPALIDELGTTSPALGLALMWDVKDGFLGPTLELLWLAAFFDGFWYCSSLSEERLRDRKRDRPREERPDEFGTSSASSSSVFGSKDRPGELLRSRDRFLLARLAYVDFLGEFCSRRGKRWLSGGGGG